MCRSRLRVPVNKRAVLGGIFARKGLPTARLAARGLRDSDVAHATDPVEGRPPYPRQTIVRRGAFGPRYGQGRYTELKSVPSVSASLRISRRGGSAEAELCLQPRLDR